MFDPDLDDTLLQDSINQVDEVLSNGSNSPVDRQGQESEVSSEENYREEAGNGGDHGHPFVESRAQRTPQRSKQMVETPEWAKTLIENQQRAIRDSAAQIDLLRSEVRALKRKRDEIGSDFTWKMKGNKKQYEFNRSVESHLEEITVAKTLHTRNSAEEGLCLVKERNKLIKIVDQHGWDTVNHYVSDPLAEDEADDKCLRKAVKDAERARDKMKSDKVAKSRRSAWARTFASTTMPMPPHQAANPSAYAQNQPQRLVVPADRSLKTSRCFRCGSAGHFQRDCVAHIAEPSSSK